MAGKFINPFTDFGFKKLFGEESNKDILMDFLNELLREEQGEIKSLRFMKNEQIGSLDADRRAVFDLYCESERGEKFIVEMQKAKQDFFKERSVFYATFPIREQAMKGTWNYDLKAVYTIGILDFIFQEDKAEPDKVVYRVKLQDIETCKVFYDKLTFIYLEMPKFKKPLSECRTHFEKWLFLLKNLGELDSRPPRLKERIFTKLFGAAEIANFNQAQMSAYQESLKVYWDMQSVLDTAKAEGKAEGRTEGRIEGEKIGVEKGKLEEKREVARRLSAKGVALSDIAEITGLPLAEVEKVCKR